MDDLSPSSNKRKNSEASIEPLEVDSPSSVAKKTKTTTRTTANSSSLNSSAIRFDVGGTIYRVSWSLLEQHPDSMLARMASDEWNNDNDNTSKEPLFIDRNGFRFQYILDYMRDGEVSLPPDTASKDAVMKELLYFGFDKVPDKAITVARDTVDLVSRLVSLEDKYKSTLKSGEDQLAQLNQEQKETKRRHSEEKTEMEQRHQAEKQALEQQHGVDANLERQLLNEQRTKNALLCLAYKVFKQFQEHGKLEMEVRRELFLDAYNLLSVNELGEKGKRYFDEFMEMFGLKVLETQHDSNTRRCTMKLAKI